MLSVKMHPVLDFGFMRIAAYSFFTGLAAIVVFIGSYFYARKRGFAGRETLYMLAGMTLAAFIGARMFNVAVNYDQYRDDLAAIFSFEMEGFSLYGGIFTAIIAGLVISRLHKVELMKFADTVTPFAGMGIMLMRVGCFLNGCCFGKETSLPWGVKFPVLSYAHLSQMNNDLLGHLDVAPVHPTQLYELIAAGFGTVLAFILIKRGKTDGTAFLVCGAYFSAFRWLNMQFRVLPYSWQVLNIWYPILYFSVIILCLGFILLNRRLTR